MQRQLTFRSEIKAAARNHGGRDHTQRSIADRIEVKGQKLTAWI